MQQRYDLKVINECPGRPTQRAPDWWDLPRFQAVCVTWSGFRQNGVTSSRPPAGNAHRWAALPLYPFSSRETPVPVRSFAHLTYTFSRSIHNAPGCMPDTPDPDRDPETMRRSRDRLMAEAAASHALLVFTHGPLSWMGADRSDRNGLSMGVSIGESVHSCMDTSDGRYRIILL